MTPDRNFSPLCLAVPRLQSASEHGLVSEEAVFNARLLSVARLLLPLSSPDLANPLKSRVTLRPWAVRWPRRHRGATRGNHNHDVLCTGRAELIADYKEARVARDAAIAVQNAADNLKEKALALAFAIKVVGHDLDTADFAESRRLRALQRDSSRLSRRWPDLLAADFADIARIAMRVNWNPIFDKATTTRQAADQCLIVNEKYYSYMEWRKDHGRSGKPWPI